MAVSRWDVWLANLDPVIGSEQGKTRPVLVLSDTQINNILGSLVFSVNQRYILKAVARPILHMAPKMEILRRKPKSHILPVVNVLPITSRKPGRRVYPNEALLSINTAGLTSESIVLCYQIRTLDKQRLIKRYGTLTDQTLQNKVIESLEFQLGLK